MAQAQDMMLSAISSIAYIRDLFSEDAYEDVKIAGMQTKRLKRGSNAHVNHLLDWYVFTLNRACMLIMVCT